MNPLRWSFRAQCLLGFLTCAGLLAFAIYMQIQMGLEPCPLCIYQRIAFAAVGVLFLAHEQFECAIGGDRRDRIVAMREPDQQVGQLLRLPLAGIQNK